MKFKPSFLTQREKIRKEWEDLLWEKSATRKAKKTMWLLAAQFLDC